MHCRLKDVRIFVLFYSRAASCTFSQLSVHVFFFILGDEQKSSFRVINTLKLQNKVNTKSSLTNKPRNESPLVARQLDMSIYVVGGLQGLEYQVTHPFRVVGMGPPGGVDPLILNLEYSDHKTRE